MLNLNPKSYIRPAIRTVAGITSFAVANAVIKNNTADPETKAQKATLMIGSYVLASLAASFAINFVDARVDSVLQDVEDSKIEREQKNQK